MNTQNSDLEIRLLQEASEPDNRRFLDRITDWYFRPKPFERSGKLYESLGVMGIKKICERIGRTPEKVRIKNNYWLWDTTKEGLKAFDYQTRINETLHLLGSIWCTTFGIMAFKEGNFGAGAIQVIALYMNTYTTMLQRYNRARLYNTIKRMEKREKHSAITKT